MSVQSSDDEQDEYIVETIRGWRYNKRMKYRKEFLIKWQNYPEDQNTYEPREHLNCSEILEKFVKNLDKREKRYYFAFNPEKLNGFQRNAKIVKCTEVSSNSTRKHKTLNEQSTSEADGFPSADLLGVVFDDSDEVENISLSILFKYEPFETIKFFERRLVYSKQY